MTASSDTPTLESESHFAPSLPLKQLRGTWDGFSEKQREIIAYLNQTDDEVIRISQMRNQQFHELLDRTYRKLGFKDALTPFEKRAAAYTLYQVIDLGRRPSGSKEALLIYALTGERTDKFEPVTQDTFRIEPTPDAEHVPRMVKPPTPQIDLTRMGARDEVICRGVDLVINLGDTPRKMLMLASNSIFDGGLLTEIRKTDPRADISTVRSYFGRAFTALGIPESMGYDIRRQIAIDIWRRYEKIRSEKPAPAKQLPKVERAAARAPVKAVKVQTPKKPKPQKEAAAIPSDDILREKVSLIKKLTRLQQTLLKEASETGSTDRKILAERVKTTMATISATRSVMARTLQVVVPTELGFREAAQYSLRTCVRIWELCQLEPPPQTILAEKPEVEESKALEETSDDAREVILLPAVPEPGDRAQDGAPAPIIIKANLALWRDRGHETALLDSSSDSFQSDLDRYLDEGWDVVDGDQVISTDGAFRARTILTLMRKRVSKD